jgi:hypothetical protein
MSEIGVGQDTYITHGKALKKCISESATKTNKIWNCRIVMWDERADTPHKCDVESCILNRIYLRNKIWGIGEKMLLYKESKSFLDSKLPNDIVLYILEKCFCRKRLRYN